MINYKLLKFSEKYPEVIDSDTGFVSIKLFSNHLLMMKELVKFRMCDQSMVDEFISDYNLLGVCEHRDNILKELLD